MASLTDKDLDAPTLTEKGHALVVCAKGIESVNA